MPRAASWSTGNRALDERWHESQWQAHRDRLEFIHSASSVSTQAFSSALAASAHPHRIHKSKANASPIRLVARSKSPAAKARQKQIDRDNLVLIKRIIAIDNAKAKPRTSSCTAKKKRVDGFSNHRYSKSTVCASARSADRNTIVVPEQAHSDHACLKPLPEVPTAASHALYTRNSATMKNNFVEYNAPTMLHSSNSTSAAARVRSRAQAKIVDENKKILRRILTARTSISRSEWKQHEEEHNRLLGIMSRHQSTSRLPQPEPFPQQTLRTARSHSSFGEGAEFPSTARSSTIRIDPTSHLVEQKQRRPRSASAVTARARLPSAQHSLPLHSARRNTSNDSLVTRMRKMTIDSQQ